MKVGPDNEKIKEKNSDYWQFITEETSNVRDREVEYPFKEDIPVQFWHPQNIGIKPASNT